MCYLKKRSLNVVCKKFKSEEKKTEQERRKEKNIEEIRIRKKKVEEKRMFHENIEKILEGFESVLKFDSEEISRKIRLTIPQ